MQGNDDNEIEEEIGGYDDENSREDADLGTGNFGNTGESEGVVVEQSWDPNNTNKLPKQGNEDNVIIEILNFTLKEGSQVLKRDDIKRLFVSMEFLNFDPLELESEIALPKPTANEPRNYNFRKSLDLIFILVKKSHILMRLL